MNSIFIVSIQKLVLNKAGGSLSLSLWLYSVPFDLNLYCIRRLNDTHIGKLRFGFARKRLFCIKTFALPRRLLHDLCSKHARILKHFAIALIQLTAWSNSIDCIHKVQLSFVLSYWFHSLSALEVRLKVLLTRGKTKAFNSAYSFFFASKIKYAGAIDTVRAQRNSKWERQL